MDVNVNNEIEAEFSIEQPEIDAEFDLSPHDLEAVLEINVTPSKVSQLENDLHYQTDDEVSQSIQEAIEPLVETIEGSELIEASRIDNIVTLKSKTFEFEQGIASDTWQIPHNLNKYPSVTLVDTAGTQFQGRVEYIDKNNCIVYMNGATKGKAFLN